MTVGGANEVFQVPKALLCHYSSYFRGALEGGSEEAKKLEVVLDLEDPKIFEALVYW